MMQNVHALASTAQLPRVQKKMIRTLLCEKLGPDICLAQQRVPKGGR